MDVTCPYCNCYVSVDESRTCPACTAPLGDAVRVEQERIAAQQAAEQERYAAEQAAMRQQQEAEELINGIAGLAAGLLGGGMAAGAAGGLLGGDPFGRQGQQPGFGQPGFQQQYAEPHRTLRMERSKHAEAVSHQPKPGGFGAAVKSQAEASKKKGGGLGGAVAKKKGR